MYNANRRGIKDHLLQCNTLVDQVKLNLCNKNIFSIFIDSQVARQTEEINQQSVQEINQSVQEINQSKE